MCSGTCNCPGMLVLVCVCTCVHVHSRASFSVSVCVPVFFPSLPAPPWLLRKLHRWQSAGCWPAICFLFYFFNSENTQSQRATATKATPLGCIKMNRVLFNDESRELLPICNLAWMWGFSGCSFDLAVEWSTAKSKKLEQEVPLGAAVCLFLFFFSKVNGQQAHLSIC